MNNEDLKPSDPSWERQTLEKLAFAMIAEQQAARRWRSFWRVIWLVVLGAGVWMAMSKTPSSTPSTLPHTAVIDIKGEIGAEGDASSVNIIDSLRAAFDDAGAQAVVLSIDSPGGSPVQAGLINDEILRLKALHKKPVYAVVGDTCASAAYYIAAAADEIYVDKASIVGSIGVLMDGFGFTGLMDKVGVERRLLTAGANKGFLDPFSPQTDKQRTHALEMLNEIHQQFIGVVKAAGEIA
jgi:protease-4